MSKWIKYKDEIVSGTIVQARIHQTGVCCFSANISWRKSGGPPMEAAARRFESLGEAERAVSELYRLVVMNCRHGCRPADWSGYPTFPTMETQIPGLIYTTTLLGS
jgi:hypothetical protein